MTADQAKALQDPSNTRREALKNTSKAAAQKLTSNLNKALGAGSATQRSIVASRKPTEDNYLEPSVNAREQPKKSKRLGIKEI